ncbi:MAG: GFA family protein [Alphaproteobacteria bacterium]|nr:MAG: GFA family protein [Alphaproteobacteria bacterium]
MNYTGSCHCGQVRFAVEAEIKDVMACNCSICSKRGYLLIFVPEAQFALHSGDAALSDYQFGERSIHHLFCKTCGVGAFGKGAGPDGAVMVAVNVRCLDDVDISAFPVTPFDGKSL